MGQQIFTVPDRLQQALRIFAAEQGVSMSRIATAGIYMYLEAEPAEAREVMKRVSEYLGESVSEIDSEPPADQAEKSGESKQRRAAKAPKKSGGASGKQQ